MADEAKKVLIVGGVAGGASCAARLRRLDEKANIVILERSGYVSYANCGLPYYIGGSIKDKWRLTLQTPESFKARFNVEVRVNSEAVSIDRDNKTVHVCNLATGEEYDESYDTLVLSPGARAIKPPLPGIDDKRIFTLRNVEDTYAIADFIAENDPKTAAVVGGGFIGLEIAENLFERGIAVTVIDKMPHVFAAFDADMAALLHNRYYDEGVQLRLNAGVSGFADKDGALEVQLDDGCNPIVADMVIMAIGVKPDTALAEAAGLPLGVRGTIKVDNHMRTIDPNIYAVGDAVEVKNRLTGQPTAIPLAGPANKQGRIAADNIAGRESTYKGSIGASIMKCFNLTAASCGFTCETADAAGLDYAYVVTNPTQHATYYPGSVYFMMKVLYEKGTNRILGAQLLGEHGVDKRINILATAMSMNMTAADLADLELAYAPPYGAAKDPVNMIGYVIENVTTGLVEPCSWDIVENLPEDAVLVDVRSPKEFAQDSWEGAINIDVDVIRDHLDELDRDKTYYIFCQVGIRGYIACRILRQNGFKCKNLEGGYAFFNAVDYASWRKEAETPCGAPISR